MYYLLNIREKEAPEKNPIKALRKVPSVDASGMTWYYPDYNLRIVYFAESDFEKYKHVWNTRSGHYVAEYKSTAADTDVEKRKLSNYKITPVNHADFAVSRAHENVRTDLHLLKTTATELREQAKSFLREKRVLTREKGQSGLTDQTVASIDSDIAEIDSAMVSIDARRVEHFPYVAEAALTFALIEGMGVMLRSEAPDVYASDPVPASSYENKAARNAKILTEALLEKAGGVIVKEEISMEMERLAKADAVVESGAYSDTGVHTPRNDRRFIPRGYDVVDEFSQADSERSSSAVQDDNLKEVLASALIAKAFRSLNPAEGPSPSRS